MARKNKQNKPKTFLAGRLVFVAVSVMVGVIGVVGWWFSPGDLWQRVPFAALAACAALVVPVCAGQLGRHKLSFVFLAPMLLFMTWSAYSIENANQTLVEAPREAIHERTQAAALARVVTAEARVASLTAKRDALQPEVVDCNPCRQTKADAAARDAVKRTQADDDIRSARADVDAAKLDVVAYAPLVDWHYVLAFGALLDLVLALGIWGLEHSARKEAQRFEQRREKERAYKSRTERAPKHRKRRDANVVTETEHAFLLQARGPRLVVNNLD